MARLSNRDVDALVQRQYEEALAEGEQWANEAYEARNHVASEPPCPVDHASRIDGGRCCIVCDGTGKVRHPEYVASYQGPDDLTEAAKGVLFAESVMADHALTGINLDEVIERSIKATAENFDFTADDLRAKINELRGAERQQ